MILALVRPVGDAIARCELTHLPRRPIDRERARRQHAAYERALERAGCRVVRLPDAPDHPDAVFVEDTAIVLPELAILTRPGAVSRRGELDAVGDALRSLHGRVARIAPPGTIDGGDVLRCGSTLFVGRSSRTNEAAIEQLRALVRPSGHDVRAVDVDGCLHLKSAATTLPDGAVLVQPQWVDPATFGDRAWIEADPDEPAAANVVSVGDAAVYSASHPKTAARLLAAGYDLGIVDVSELEKAEGAVTCCSVVFDDPEPSRASGAR